MQSQFRFLTGVVFALSLSSVRADEPPRKEPASAELVRQLADPNFRMRQKAEKELLRRGEECLPELQRGAADDDPEIRSRCKEILDQIPQSETDRFLAPFIARQDDSRSVFPGWNALRGILGDDDGSRFLYAKLYKSDRRLLEAIEKAPKTIGEQFESRMQKIYPQASAIVPRAGESPQVRTEDIAALLLIANIARPALDMSASQRILSIFQQPATGQAVGWSDATRRLAAKWLESKCDDAQLAPQLASAAVVLGCRSLIDEKLRPAASRLIDEASAKPDDLNLVFRAINLATQLNMRETLEGKLRPAVSKGIESAVREPININKLNQLTSAMQSLGGVDDPLRQTIRPALEVLIKKQADDFNELSKFYTILSLARIARCQDLLDDHLCPAFRASMIRMISQPTLDFAKLTQTFYHAQNLGMHDEIESILKPAALRLIAATLDGKADASRYQQAFSAAQAFQIREAVVPLAKRLLDDSVTTTPDLNRIAQAVQMARAANVPDLDDVLAKKIKPAVREGLSALAKSLDANSAAMKLVPALVLADQLKLKEGVDLAVAAAEMKSLPAPQRSQALFILAKIGGKDAIAKIEPLLDEKTELGTANVGGIVVRAQLRDVALAAAIQLNGQKLTDYEFPFFKLVGVNVLNQGVYQPPGWYGFENDATRVAAQKKYRESRVSK